jgi:hypothetical protein
MNVKEIFINPFADISDFICVIPLGNRLYRLAHDLVISFKTDEGTFCFTFKPGFVTNFRSGGILIDRFIDQIGDLWQQAAYLCHDAAYTPCAALKMEHPISRKLADQLLRAVLVKCGMGKFKASLVYNSVRLFGKSAYEDDDELTEKNSKLFNFEWSADNG